MGRRRARGPAGAKGADVTLTSILGTGIAAVSGDWAITRAVVAGGLGDALYVAQDPTPATCLIVRDSTLRGFLYADQVATRAVAR